MPALRRVLQFCCRNFALPIKNVQEAQEPRSCQPGLILLRRFSCVLKSKLEF